MFVSSKSSPAQLIHFKDYFASKFARLVKEKSGWQCRLPGKWICGLPRQEPPSSEAPLREHTETHRENGSLSSFKELTLKNHLSHCPASSKVLHIEPMLMTMEYMARERANKVGF